MRCLELNLPMCRLGLFLDPRYKAAVDTPQGFKSLVQTVSWTFAAYSLCLIARQRGLSHLLPAVAELLPPLQANQQPPFVANPVSNAVAAIAAKK